MAIANGALVAISAGLIVTPPTALTSLLDYLDLPPRSAARTLALYHLLAMLTATVLFVATWVAQRPGYINGEVTTLALILGLPGFAVLLIGGTLGGTLYRVRVVAADVSIADALIPGRLDQPAKPSFADAAPRDSMQR